MPSLQRLHPSAAVLLIRLWAGCLAQEMVPQPGGLQGAVAALGLVAGGGTEKRRAPGRRQGAAPLAESLAEVCAWSGPIEQHQGAL